MKRFLVISVLLLVTLFVGIGVNAAMDVDDIEATSIRAELANAKWNAEYDYWINYDVMSLVKDYLRTNENIDHDSIATVQVMHGIDGYCDYWAYDCNGDIVAEGSDVSIRYLEECVCK